MKTRICISFVGAILLISSLAFSQQTNRAENLYQEALMQMEGKGNYSKALDIFGQIMKDFPGSRQISAQSQYQIGVCYEKLGKSEAQKAYERVIKDFGDQREVVAQARVRLAALGGPSGAGELATRRILTDASSVNGVLTADGKYISRIDWETGDMIQFEVANAQTRRIANKGGAEAKEVPYSYQAFSREGKQIAYDSYTKNYVPQLRIRYLDGSGLRTLYSEKGYDVRPLDWSPDAGFILASRELDKSPNGGIELALISTADGSVRVLRSIASAWVSARFSRDGRFIAFNYVSEGNPPQGNICLMTADGRNEVVVAGHPADNQLLGWTPDGRSLVFLSDRSGTRDIWTVHIAGGKQQGEPELLKKGFEDSEVLGFAPDGSLYYKTNTYFGHLYIGELDLETGKVLVPPAPVTTRYTGPTNFLTWSPDGRNLAYLSHPGRIGPGNNFLTIRSAATGEEHFLLPRLRGVNQISWAPDGRSIIALGFTATGTGIFRIDTGTSAITKLADEGVFARLCPDGKTLVSWSVKGIIKRNLETGEESEVVKAGMHYALSPDGQEVVFQVDGAVKTVSLNGGEPRELFRGLAKYYGLGWTRDGRYIIARAFGSGSGEMWRVPAQGGTPLKLDISDPKMMAFALYPDNRCAFSIDEGSKSELWVMENFLPKEGQENK